MRTILRILSGHPPFSSPLRAFLSAIALATADASLRLCVYFPLFSLLAAAGCHKGESPAALAAEQAAPAVQKAFEGAAPEAKGLATDLADSMRDKDYPKALGRLNDLDDRKDLTADQRQASARTRMTVMQQLAAAAANGDARAAEALKAYKSSK